MALVGTEYVTPAACGAALGSTWHDHPVVAAGKVITPVVAVPPVPTLIVNAAGPLLCGMVGVVPNPLAMVGAVELVSTCPVLVSMVVILAVVNVGDAGVQPVQLVTVNGPTITVAVAGVMVTVPPVMLSRSPATSVRDEVDEPRLRLSPATSDNPVPLFSNSKKSPVESVTLKLPVDSRLKFPGLPAPGVNVTWAAPPPCVMLSMVHWDVPELQISAVTMPGSRWPERTSSTTQHGR